MTVKDGYVYGRGVADDKGPLLSALYGMYALKQSGFYPNKRVRFIIGTNEETNWGCMNYYKEHCEIPHASFSPDGMFTVVNREKGILSIDFQKKLQTFGITIDGGEARNLVPSKAVAFLNCSLDALNRAIDSCRQSSKVTFAAESCNDGVKLICTGKSAHAMKPQDGISAVMGILKVISSCEGISEELKYEAAQLLELLGTSPDGKAMGIACDDEVSGALTVNLGVLTLEDDILTLSFDIRSPVTVDPDKIAESIRELMEQKGYKMTSNHIKYPLYVPADNELIKILCSVYETVAQEKAELYSIGGGTYARAFPNCVCFGAVYPNEKLTVHMPNERALIENIVKNAKMYGLAIHELTK
jgi:succinyl-diaminopimelate desuccinylase